MAVLWAEGLVEMLVAVMFMRGLFLGHRGTCSRLTSALHVIHHGHHHSAVRGFFVDILNLQDLGEVGSKTGSQARVTNATSLVCDFVDVNV